MRELASREDASGIYELLPEGVKTTNNKLERPTSAQSGGKWRLWRNQRDGRGAIGSAVEAPARDQGISQIPAADMSQPRDFLIARLEEVGRIEKHQVHNLISAWTMTESLARPRPRLIDNYRLSPRHVRTCGNALRKVARAPGQSQRQAQGRGELRQANRQRQN